MELENINIAETEAYIRFLRDRVKDDGRDLAHLIGTVGNMLEANRRVIFWLKNFQDEIDDEETRLKFTKLVTELEQFLKVKE